MADKGQTQHNWPKHGKTAAGVEMMQIHKHDSKQGTKRGKWSNQKKRKKLAARHKNIDLIIKCAANREAAQKPNGCKPRKQMQTNKQTNIGLLQKPVTTTEVLQACRGRS